MKTIKIALLGTPHDYKFGIVPLIINQLGYAISWVGQREADLQIYGPFYPRNQKPFRWAPKPIRPLITKIGSGIDRGLSGRQSPPVTLFHTGESLRHDTFNTNFSISFDLGVQSPNHFRLPYWMELVDWSHEGIVGNSNPRYGRLLSLKQMRLPLGDSFLSRTPKAAMITSHLLEPRKTLYHAVNQAVGVTGFGPYFNKSIANHHSSNFTKEKILQDFAFNLCPENQLYPGYYTEKIPESFLSGALPLTWVDSNVCADFNPAAFINLEPMTWNRFESLGELLNDRTYLKSFCEQPLLTKELSLEPAKGFIKEILRQSLN
jgi:Glycosyltransferase family 10 (fucosyltransferase) C-term